MHGWEGEMRLGRSQVARCLTSLDEDKACWAEAKLRHCAISWSKHDRPKHTLYSAMCGSSPTLVRCFRYYFSFPHLFATLSTHLPYAVSCRVYGKKAAALRHKCRNNGVSSVATNSADFARISFAPSRRLKAWPGLGQERGARRPA